MRIARPGGNEVDRMAVPDGGAATSESRLHRPAFKIFIYAFCALDTIACRTRAPPPCAPQAARRAVRTPAAGRQPPAGGFSGNGTLFADTQHYTQRIRASRHPLHPPLPALAYGEEAPLAAGRVRREARERGKQNFLAH